MITNTNLHNNQTNLGKDAIIFLSLKGRCLQCLQKRKKGVGRRKCKKKQLVCVDDGEQKLVPVEMKILVPEKIAALVPVVDKKSDGVSEDVEELKDLDKGVVPKEFKDVDKAIDKIYSSKDNFFLLTKCLPEKVQLCITLNTSLIRYQKTHGIRIPVIREALKISERTRIKATLYDIVEHQQENKQYNIRVEELLKQILEDLALWE